MAPTVGRSVVACSAVSCLDRAGSYSRLQCDKRGMRPSPRSAGPAHGRTRSKLLLLPPKSGVSPLPPPLAPRRIQCYRLRITANDATPTPPSVSPYTRREHSLTHSLATRKTKRGKAVCLHRARRRLRFGQRPRRRIARPWAHMQNSPLCTDTVYCAESTHNFVSPT